MHHVFYFNGDAEKISWTIQTEDSTVNQYREHVKIYKNKITKVQSKYVALHIGLFWGIGVFVIKNNDSIKIKLDEKIMYEQLTSKLKVEDEFIEKRIQFIKQLITQRKLKIEFEMINVNENLSRKNFNSN